MFEPARQVERVSVLTVRDQQVADKVILGSIGYDPSGRAFAAHPLFQISDSTCHVESFDNTINILGRLRCP